MTKDLLASRLSALNSYQVLDTPAESAFDDIVFIASRVCRAPVALVSLVEDDRQWFKARVGVDMCETPISQSVCQHGMAGTEMLIIPDLTADPRTAANTLVTEDPHIRFYAGAPLVTPAGVTIGMLCVIDVAIRPEGLSEEQAQVLSALARQVVAQLELRSGLIREQISADKLRESDARFRLAEEAGQIGTFEVDVLNGTISVSPQLCRLFGVPQAEQYRTTDLEALIKPEGLEIGSSEASRSDGSAEALVEYQIRRPSDGQIRWIARRADFVRDAQGTVIGMIGALQDVTNQRMVNEEIGHRLKNSMALVQALAAHTFKKVVDREPVLEFERRLRALATAHDALLERSRAAAPMQAIAEAVFANLGATARVDVRGAAIELGPQSTLTFSMLLHELATNAIKYGALSSGAGRIALEWQEDGADAVVRWVESGGPAVRPPGKKGFGSRLISRGMLGNGGADLAYAETGFTAAMRAPLSELSN